MNNPDHIDGFDGLRGLAIALVLLSHTLIYGEFSRFARVGLNAGYAGVGVFFVLSGYLITRLLLREERDFGGVSLRRFYARRALRLFPALWSYLLVVFGLWIIGFFPEHPWHSFAAALFYVRNLIGHGHETEHLWSLSVEEQFYLIWPVVLVFFRRRDKTRLTIAGAGVLAITAWRFVAVHYRIASDGALYIRTDFRLDEPIVGSALALSEAVAPQIFQAFSRTSLARAAFATGAYGGLALWLAMKGPEAAAFDTAIVAAVGLGLVITRGISWSPAVKLGRISYGVYLWQQLFLGPKIQGLNHIRTFPIGILLTLAVAAVSYRFVEKPFLRLKQRRFSRSAPRLRLAQTA